MKNPSKPFSRKGFTLVELLVVIAIIAVLAAAGFAVGPTMLNKAKKVSALNTATSLSNAVEQFYTEYSALPTVGSGVLTTTSAGGVSLLNILAGKETAAAPENPRKIRFFSAKDAKGTRDGAVYDGTTGAFTALYDPWGGPYSVVLDDDYNEELVVSPLGSSTTLRGRKIAVYSLGVASGEKSNTSTLVKSW